MKKINLPDDFRYERKFITSQLEPCKIKHLIKHHPAMFSEAFYERQVNNIYFDSVDSKNYHDNLSGNAKRIKVRIRWYGKMFGLLKNPVLEFKMKNGFLGKKKSFNLKPFIFDKNFCFKFLQKEILEKSNLPLNILEMFKLSRPVLVNSYKRKYFVSANKKIRITLDRDLEFFKIKERNNMFAEKTLDKNLQILELKYPENYEDKISDITQHFPFRVVAISKYIHGVTFLERH